MRCCARWVKLDVLVSLMVIEELLQHEACGPHCSGLQTMSDRDYHTLTWVARETWDSDKLVQLDPWDKVYNMQMHELIALKIQP